MPPINSDPTLHFIWLEVSDLERSIHFYRETLGLVVQEDTDSFAIVQLTNSKLYLAPGRPLGMNMYIAIAFTNIDIIHERLLDHNINVSAPTDEGWARYINLIDPDGYRLLLLESAEEGMAP
jgi:catechol 2,3-dioxygenase-like lactoylglutathione lyase family enzyme